MEADACGGGRDGGIPLAPRQRPAAAGGKAMTRQEDWQMSADQQFCFQLLSDCFGGAHHVPRLRKCGHGIKVSVYSGSLSTFDFDLLTRLVFLAHDRCVRVEIVSSGPGRVGIMLHRRRGRDGDIFERHPSLDDAIADHRRSFPDHLPLPEAP